MNSGFIIIIIILLVAILVSSMYNILIFRRREKTLNNTDLDSSKYFELKYRIEYLTTIVPIVIVFLGIMGYREVDSIEKGINSKIDEKVKPKLDSLDKQIAFLQNRQQNVKSGLDTSFQSLSDFKTSFQELQKKMTGIEGKDIIRQNIYIVRNLKTKRNGDFEQYNFKEITTITGNKLPDFKTIPTILSVNDNSLDMKICNTSLTGFYAANYSSLEDPKFCSQKGEYSTFSVIIFEK
jgi:hypothetical protein